VLLNKCLLGSSLIGMTLCTNPVLANLLPAQWQQTIAGVFSASAEGQYYMQSYNLLSDGDTILNDEPGSIVEQYPLFNSQKNNSWGYRANLGYLFPNHDWDIRASYTQILDSGSNKSLALDDLNFSGTTEQKNTYDFQAADLTLGYFMPFSNWFDIRLGFGVAYADIKQHAKNTVIDVDTTVVDSAFKTTYSGIGPKFSISTAYAFDTNFSLVTDLGFAALFGSSKATGNFALGDNFENQELSTKKSAQFSPAVDGKLGLNYTHRLTHCSRWNIELGYRGAYYSDALQDEANAFDGVGSDDRDPFSKTDYFNHGPYLSVGFDFM